MSTDTDPISGTSLMRLKEVIRRTGLSRSEIYRQIKSKDFPESIKIGKYMVAWHSLEVDHWIAKRIAGRNATQHAKSSGRLRQCGKPGRGGVK